MKSIETSGKSFQLALDKGLGELQVSADQVKVTTLITGGALKQWKLLLEVITEGEIAAQFIRQLLEKMALNLQVDFKETDEEVIINLIGSDSGVIIGYRGEVLDSIQYLTNLICNIKGGDKRIIVDSESYREKRIATLTQLAKNLESKAVRTGRNCKLEPMNPYERRIIHATLQDSETVTTVSEGVAPNRYIVVTLKNQVRKDKNINSGRDKKPFSKDYPKFKNDYKDTDKNKRDVKPPIKTETIQKIEQDELKNKKHKTPYPYMAADDAALIDEDIVFIAKERPRVNTTVGQKEIKFAFSSSKKKR